MAFKEEAMRLLRERWKDPNMLAEELYVIFKSWDEGLTGPLKVNNPTSDPGIQITSSGGDTSFVFGRNGDQSSTLSDDANNAARRNSRENIQAFFGTVSGGGPVTYSVVDDFGGRFSVRQRSSERAQLSPNQQVLVIKDARGRYWMNEQPDTSGTERAYRLAEISTQSGSGSLSTYLVNIYDGSDYASTQRAFAETDVTARRVGDTKRFLIGELCVVFEDETGWQILKLQETELKSQFNAGEVVLRLHSHTDNQTVISMTAPQQSLQSGSVAVTQSAAAAILDSASFSSLFVELVDAVEYLYGETNRSKIEYIIPVGGFAATGGILKSSLHPYVARGISASQPIATVQDSASLFASVPLGAISTSMSHTMSPLYGAVQSTSLVPALTGSSSFSQETFTWSIPTPPASFTTGSYVTPDYVLDAGTYTFSSFSYSAVSLSARISTRLVSVSIQLPSNIQALNSPSFLRWASSLSLGARGLFPFTGNGGFIGGTAIMDWIGSGSSSGYFDSALEASSGAP